MYPLTENRAGLAPLLAWPLLCLALILTGLVFHIESQQIPWAWPAPNGWQINPQWLGLLAATIGSLAAILTVFSIRSVYRQAQLGTGLEWVSLHVLVFSCIWVILPATISPAWFWLLGATLLTGTLVLAIRSSNALEVEPGSTPSHYFFSRRNALSDCLFILSPLIAGYWATQGFGLQAAGGTILFSVVLYPLYALFQLCLFLLIPATRMQKMGYSARAIAISCALVFSLLHWPNPLLMAVTGFVMLIWARQFLRGRSILALALVMGIAATGVRFMLPQAWTGEMRIGPDYIEKRAQHSMKDQS